jgi:hypothetical protein
MHELTHFFFRHLNSYDQSEVTAQLTVKYFDLATRYLTLDKLLKITKTLEEMKKGVTSSNE